MVLHSARRQLDELAPLARELNTGSDAYTQELKTLEADLVKLGLGVDVTLFSRPLLEGPTRDGDEEGQAPDRVVSYLAYGRYRSGWRILVRTFREWKDAESGDEGVQALQTEEPLVDASRELRVASADLVDGLLRALTSEAKERVESLNKVIDKAILPESWTKRHLGLDEARHVHVLKPDLKGETLCGAAIVTTNFAHSGVRPCEACVRQTER